MGKQDGKSDKKYHIGQVIFKDEKEKRETYKAIKSTGNTFSSWTRRLILGKLKGMGNETN